MCNMGVVELVNGQLIDCVCMKGGAAYFSPMDINARTYCAPLLADDCCLVPHLVLGFPALYVQLHSFDGSN